MKKLVALILCLCMACSLFSGASLAQTDKAEIVTQQNTAPTSISGVFIQPWLYMSYSSADWEREFTELKKLGVDTVIMGDVAVKNGDKWGFYYDSYLDIAEEGYKYEDAVTPLLQHCKEYGMKVYLGTGLDGYWWSANLSKDEDIAWFEEFTQISVEIAQDLYDTYKKAYPETFYGFYSVHEIWNHHAWRTESTRSKYADTLSGYFNSMVAAIEKMDPNMPIMFSPFSTAKGFANQQQTQAFYTEFFEKSNFRSIDAMAPMDNIGGGGMSLELLPTWTKGYYDAIQDSGSNIQLWSNCENFVQPKGDEIDNNDKWGACDVGRYVKQMETVKPYVSKIISFSYSHYFSPVNTVAGFHETFLEYLQTGKLEDQPPTPPTKVKTSLVTVGYNERVCLEWSGMYDNKGISRVNIYKNGVYYDYALAIKNDGSGKMPYAPYKYVDPKSNKNTTATYEIEVIDCAGNPSETRTKVEVQAGAADNGVILDSPFADIWDPSDPMGLQPYQSHNTEAKDWYVPIFDFDQSCFKVDDKVSDHNNVSSNFIKIEKQAVEEGALDASIVTTANGSKGLALDNKGNADRQVSTTFMLSDVICNTKILPEGAGIPAKDMENGISFYVDTTGYTGAHGIILQFTEKDGAKSDTTRRTFINGAKAYAQDSTGNFTQQLEISQFGYLELPQQYQGFIQVPFGSFHTTWGTPDSNWRVDLVQVESLIIYRSIQENSGTLILDEFGFYGPKVVSSGSFMRGDGNNDGVVDIKDALLALRISVDLVPPTPEQIEALDVVESGEVDIKDALRILQYSVKLIPEL